MKVQSYTRSAKESIAFDEGLRQFMLNMYNHTASGLAISGAVAWLTFSSGLLSANPSRFIVKQIINKRTKNPI